MEIAIILLMLVVGVFLLAFARARKDIIEEMQADQQSKSMRVYVQELHPTVFLAYGEFDEYLAQAHSYPELLITLQEKFPTKVLMIEHLEIQG